MIPVSAELRARAGRPARDTSFRDLLRNHIGFFFFATLAGVGLRLLFIFLCPGITVDSFIYGDIAKNWLQHGIYGVSEAGAVVPTYVRLPGYPAFLAGIFATFGMEHYRAVLVAQLFVDIGTCLVIADLARRVVGRRASRTAFLLAALCPFFANYAGAALTETLEIFFTVLALDLAIAGLQSLWDSDSAVSAHVLRWAGCGVAVASAILLRPDGGLLLIAIQLYLFALLLRPLWSKLQAAAPANVASQIVTAGLIVGVVALAPLVPWTLRNLRVLDQFEPLAPRYANQESEFVPMGFNRWVKTWVADYVSNEEVYWQEPGAPIDPQSLPSRAFDSEQQRQETLQLLADYNQNLHITPALDQRFAELAAQRIHSAPLRYYVWLPAVRIADMWLRPRTELLPSDSRWWEFNDDPRWSALALGLGVLNLAYIAAALAGLVRGRFAVGLGLLLTFVVVRSVFLGSVESPEPRYMLECFPVVIVLAGALWPRRCGGAALRRVHTMAE